MPSFTPNTANPQRSASLRRTTPDTVAAREYAHHYRFGDGPSISRNEALRIAKLAAAAMGLKSSKIALIDQLFAYSQKADWTDPARPPIVWPSNDALARSLGISVSTMKHHLNGLCRAGIISFSDGPTYQRRGRRDQQGNIIEAQGIDLSPIAGRYAELRELADAAAYQAREWKRLSNTRTVLRKQIQSLILSAGEQRFPGPWARAQARLDVIRESKADNLDQLTAWVDELMVLADELEEAYSAAFYELNTDTAVSKFRPILTTADTLSSESCSNTRPRADAREPITRVAYGQEALEQEPAAIFSPKQSKYGDLSDDVRLISLPLVRDACPALHDFVPQALTNWAALRASGHDLCRLASINPQVWQEATSILGPDLAIAALAVTVQKSCDGLVSKPGAYLRTLVQRGRAGQLRISRSLFAMVQASTSPAIARKGA